MIKPKPSYSRKLIKDEFTSLKVSRGRKWQLRRVKAGLCIRCNNPVAPGLELCVQHKIEQALAYRKKLNSPRPHKGKWVGDGKIAKLKTSRRKDSLKAALKRRK